MHVNGLERVFLRRAALNFLKKHWGTIVSVAGPVLVFLEPSLHAYALANPKTAIGVIAGALVLMFNSRAPKDKQ